MCNIVWEEDEPPSDQRSHRRAKERSERGRRGGVKMTIKEIFEKVNLVAAIEQRRFFNYYEDTVEELSAAYPGFVFSEGAEYTPPEDLNAENVVLPLYHNAIVDNVLFLMTNEPTYKNEFLRKSRVAWLVYWNEKAKGKRIKRMRW